MRIVALTGPKGSGKNTLAEMIIGAVSDLDVALEVADVAFADPLRWAADALGVGGRLVTSAKNTPCRELGGHTGREFLIGLGEMLRGFNPDFFADHMRQRLDVLPSGDDETYPADCVIVTDARRVNELDALRGWVAANPGSDLACLWVERPGCDDDEVLQTEIRSRCVVVSNAGSLADLEVKAAGIAEWLTGVGPRAVRESA